MEQREQPPTLGSWRPAERTRRLIGFALLLLSTATLLTNAYYLRFAEPTVSRKAVALGLVVLTALWFLLGRFGLPRNREELRAGFERGRTPILLGAILVVAFAVRYEGIGSGLPQSYIPDEYDYVHSYLQMIKRGDMNPRWWHHPSVQPYVNVATYLGVFFLQAGEGRWRSIHQLQVEDMLFWGRLAAGVIPGTLAVLFVFFLGRRVFDTRVGLLGAALLAVAPGVVEVSQYNKPDSLLVLFSTVGVLATMIYLDRGGPKLAFAAGAAIGFTVAVKYNAALLLIPFTAAVAFRQRFRFFSTPDIYLGAVGSIAGFIAGCPYFYADLARFLAHVGDGIYNYGFAGLAGAQGVNNWYNHARYTVVYGAGLLPVLLALSGLVVALYRIDRRLAVFLAYPIIYYSFYSSQKINFAGNLMPVYPFLAILAGFGIAESIALVERRLEARVGRSARSRALGSVALLVVLVLVLWFPVSMTLRHNRLVTLPDTGTMAALWIESRYPEGTHFALERQTPFLDRTRFQITQESVLVRRSVEDYREAGVRYLVVSSTVYKRFGANSRRGRAYERLFNICPLVKEFAPVEGRLMGPTIRILEVPAG